MSDEYNSSVLAEGDDSAMSPYRGGIHNVQITTEENLETVNEHLYALVTESETTYDLPYDAPMYAKLFLYQPDETDIKESEAGNPN